MKTIGLLLLLASTVPGSSSPNLEERRTFYPGGRPYEVRHFRNGREEGRQQAWTEDGTLYINYEMRNGRRYGFINARPCLPVEEKR
ncbi:MAG: hypothetical protein ABL971_08895 [Vicinamibacterales bacterium]